MSEKEKKISIQKYYTDGKTALSKASKELQELVKKKKGTAKWTYVPLDYMLPIIKEILAKHNLYYEHSLELASDATTQVSVLQATIHHNQGDVMTQVKEVNLVLPKYDECLKIRDAERSEKSGSQKMGVVQYLGSSITYLRRYSLFVLLDIFPDDDKDDFSPRDDRYQKKKAEPYKPKVMSQPPNIVSEPEPLPLQAEGSVDDQLKHIYSQLIKKTPLSSLEDLIKQYSANGINKETLLKKMKEQLKTLNKHF